MDSWKEKRQQMKIINYNGQTMTTKYEYDELTNNEFEQIRKEYYSKPTIEQVKSEMKNISNGGVKNTHITNYYFRDLLDKTKVSRNKWCIEDVFNSKELLSYFWARTKMNDKVFLEGESTRRKLDTAFRIGGMSIATRVSNFPIKTVDEILERYNINNNYYDYSCGWGARLTSALRNKVNYFGTEPNYLLTEQLNKFAKNYKTYLKQDTIVDIRTHGSEEFVKEWENKMGVAFSSPPYFDLENYQVGNQSYKEGTTYQEWLDNYLQPTINNIYRYLIQDGYFIINIKNLPEYKLADDACKIAINSGFEFVETMSLKVCGKPKLNNGQNFVDTDENIYVFKKIKDKKDVPILETKREVNSMKWNYVSQIEQSNGYEDKKIKVKDGEMNYIDFFKKYNSEFYKSLTPDKQEKLIEKVFNMYRSVNIYPITYYNEDGIINELKSCINKDIDPNWDILDFKYNQGQSLCRFLFPNLHRVDVKSSKNNSMYDRFNDDHKLKRAIKLCFDIKDNAAPSQLRTAMELIGGGVATNFKSMNAKALYEKYCPKNGVIYDFAAGFGGRMIGALTSKNNYKYIAVEPCSETYDNLLELGNYIKMATGREKIFKLFKCGSEEINKHYDKNNSIDFAFSSPPYFNLEKYSDEDTQCYIKFQEISDWLDGYVKPTIQNIYNLLKPNSYYAVNIADFKVGKDEIKYVDEWIRISEEIGFKYIEQVPMKLSTRKGFGHKDENGKDKLKKEGIFVFQKI